MTMTREQILELIGDPAETARRIRSFQRSAIVLEDGTVRERYCGRWVAAFEGKVVADSEGLDALLRQIDAMGVPRGQVAVQFMSDDDSPLIV